MVILYRTGGVLSLFDGSLEEAEAECDRRNAIDDGGSTEVHASFDSAEEAEAEFQRLNALLNP